MLGQNTSSSRDRLIRNSHNRCLLGAGSVPGDMLNMQKGMQNITREMAKSRALEPGMGMESGFQALSLLASSLASSNLDFLIYKIGAIRPFSGGCWGD